MYRSDELAGAAVGGEGVEERLEESHPGAELVVDRHPCDAGLARHGIDREARQPALCREELAGCGDDPRAGLLGGGLPAAELVGARTHELECRAFGVTV